MTGIPTWHERAMAHPDHQSGMVSEDMIRARMAEEIADLRAEIERLRRINALLDRNEREFIAAIGLVATTLLGTKHDFSNPIPSMKKRVLDEVEKRIRERDEARAALRPFSELYLWPDDAGRLIAERVRSREDWDEAANDAESNEFGITRGDIRAARRAMEAKP